MTASNFGRICRNINNTKVVQDLLHPKELKKVPAIKYGNEMEAIAARAVEELLKITLDKSGLHVLEAAPFLAATPDRTTIINGETFVVEIKCPFSAKDKFINEKTVPYLAKVNETLNLKPSHDYFYQVQGQLMCSGFKKCLFAVYTEVDCKVMTIMRDDNFINTMFNTLNEFYERNFKPKMLDIYLYKSG